MDPTYLFSQFTFYNLMINRGKKFAFKLYDSPYFGLFIFFNKTQAFIGENICDKTL